MIRSAIKSNRAFFYQRIIDETSETGKMRETAVEWLKKNN